MVKNIVNNLEKGNHTLGAFIDLIQAFNCVNHNILMNELNICGVRGVALDWIKAYLKDRNQCVEIQGKRSTFLLINSGEPQGSVLGPVLYNLYVNRLAKIIQHLYTIMYADDIMLSLAERSQENLEITSTIKLSELLDYLDSLNLHINFNKSSLVKFSTNYINSNSINIIINDEQLNSVSSVKYLGITIDEHLTWKTHIENLCNSLSSSTFLLRTIAPLRNAQLLKLCYFSLIESRITYGIAVWGRARKIHLDRLFKIQKKAKRILAGLRKRQSCREAFKSLQILTLSSIYILEVITYTRFGEHTTFNEDIHTHKTRQIQDIHCKTYKLEISATLTQNIGAILFNKLPPNLKKLSEKRKFKKCLKKYLVNGVYYSVDEFILNHTHV